MANTITDNRTVLFNGGDGTGGAPVDLAGIATGTADTSTFLQGTSSYTLSVSNSRAGIMYDATTAQNWANNVFYFTVNCGVVGLLDLKANGGMTVRFCGATVTNWFEVYVAGSDSWPNSIQGGWTNFVVDITDARATAVTNGWTGGTAPAASAIRYVGITTLLTTMPKMADNLWIDTIHRLPDATPGIIVQGRNGGTTDWNAANILTQLGSGQMAYFQGPGGSYSISTPIQFGVNDTVTHGFTATNGVWLWANQEYAPSDLYGLSALGNVGGTTNVTLGVKSGTGDDATGSQGFTITAASTGARWGMDFNDPNIDGANFYGCSLIHGGAFLLDDPAVSCISTLYIDCSSALVSNSEQLRVSAINAATADGVPFMTTDDLGDIVFSTFQFSDGHGVALTTPRVATQTSKGNVFTGYGAIASNDAAVYNNSAGAVTINVGNGGSSPTYRNGTSASTVVVLDPVTVAVTVQDVDTNLPIENARVYMQAATGGIYPYQASVTITRVSSTASVAHTAHGMANGDQVRIRGANQSEYIGVFVISNVTTNAYDFTVTGTPTTPATGTITATWVLYEGDLTNASGVVTDSRTYSGNQPISGRVRKSTASPLYKTAQLTGTILSASGLSQTALMQSDE